MAIYFYALLLVASALVRDYYVKLGLEATESSVSPRFDSESAVLNTKNTTVVDSCSLLEYPIET